MLYTNTEDALCELLSRSQHKSGKVCLIIDVDTLGVVANFYADIDEKQDLHLQPSQFLVTTILHPAKEIGVSIRSAAVSAIHALSAIVNIENDTGDIPWQYACMTLPTGEVVPYDAAVMGFLHEDCYINDPTVSECGRFTVNPVETYGFTPTKGEDGKAYLVRQLDDGELRLINPTDPSKIEAGFPGNELVRLDVAGAILAKVTVDQIPTGDDYPEDILELSAKASRTPGPTPPTPDYLVHGLTGTESRADVERAINLLINEGLMAATHLEDATGAPLDGPAGAAMRIDFGSPALYEVDPATSTGKLSIPCRATGSISQDEISEALEWVMQQGQARIRVTQNPSPAVPTIDLSVTLAP